MLPSQPLSQPPHPAPTQLASRREGGATQQRWLWEVEHIHSPSANCCSPLGIMGQSHNCFCGSRAVQLGAHPVLPIIPAIMDTDSETLGKNHEGPAPLLLPESAGELFSPFPLLPTVPQEGC